MGNISYPIRLAVQAGLAFSFAAIGSAQTLVPGHLTACAALTCTLAASSGSGNLLVVGVQLGGGINTGTVITSVTDNVGNTYNQASGAGAIDSAAGSVVDFWYAKNSLPGATTLTIAASPAVSGGAVVWEFSGVDQTAPLDQVAALNSQTSTTTPSGAPVATATTNEVVISLAAVSGTISGIASGNAFTNDSVLKGDGWAHLMASSAGTYSASWAASPAGTYASSTVSFKASGSAPVQTSCDVNGDGSVNVVDVQLITNMELGASGFSCSANVQGLLGCSDPARQVVIKASLGQGCHFNSLTWSPSPSSGVVGYNIYRGTSSGGESSTPLNTGGPVVGTSYTDVTTVAGMTYSYVVKASDGTVESTPSTEASATAH